VPGSPLLVAFGLLPHPALPDGAAATTPPRVPPSPVVQPTATAHRDAPYCMQCGVQMQRAGSCHACPSCGSTSGCS
jgi:ribonucleoside-diphosphate reductase alpha chain